jgi:hypothetical protein
LERAYRTQGSINLVRLGHLARDFKSPTSASIRRSVSISSSCSADLSPARVIPIDSTLRAELIEGRDLHEHWAENAPVFNVTPRVVQPRYRTGKNFAARNPDHGPYWWLGWSNKTGPMLLPHVPASGVHEFVDAVEAEVLAQDGVLQRFVPPRAPSPWLVEDGEWWPRR